MVVRDRLIREVKELALASVYFFSWIGLLVVIKKLVLAEYQIEFSGLSMALVGALVLAKVVLILEHVPLALLTRSRPAWIGVVWRTALYFFGVLVVLLLERGFEGRHEYGGLWPSLTSVIRHPETPHVWANAICVAGALLGFNVLSVIRRHLGEGGLVRLFLDRQPEVDAEEA